MIWREVAAAVNSGKLHFEKKMTSVDEKTECAYFNFMSGPKIPESVKVRKAARRV